MAQTQIFFKFPTKTQSLAFPPSRARERICLLRLLHFTCNDVRGNFAGLAMTGYLPYPLPTQGWQVWKALRRSLPCRITGLKKYFNGRRIKLARVALWCKRSLTIFWMRKSAAMYGRTGAARSIRLVHARPEVLFCFRPPLGPARAGWGHDDAGTPPHK